MRIIAVGDIHMDYHFLHLIEAIGTADLLILNGDLTNFGYRADAEQVIEQARKVNPNVRAQFGNLDHPEVNDFLESIGINLHNQAIIIDGKICLAGIGASNPTPFATPSEFPESTINTIAWNVFSHAKDIIRKHQQVVKNEIPLILVSHAPPYQTSVDRLTDGSSVGSVAIRECIEREAPDLCICGHIHEAAGMDYIGATPVYNPGMLKDGGWLEIELINQNINATLHDSI